MSEKVVRTEIELTDCGYGGSRLNVGDYLGEAGFAIGDEVVVIPAEDYDGNAAVVERVKRFMIDNKVTCAETIHQCDWVIENAYDFMEDLFNLVKGDLPGCEES